MGQLPAHGPPLIQIAAARATSRQVHWHREYTPLLPTFAPQAAYAMPLGVIFYLLRMHPNFWLASTIRPLKLCEELHNHPAIPYQ